MSSVGSLVEHHVPALAARPLLTFESNTQHSSEARVKSLTEQALPLRKPFSHYATQHSPEVINLLSSDDEDDNPFVTGHHGLRDASYLPPSRRRSVPRSNPGEISVDQRQAPRRFIPPPIEMLDQSPSRKAPGAYDATAGRRDLFKSESSPPSDSDEGSSYPSTSEASEELGRDFDPGQAKAQVVVIEDDLPASQIPQNSALQNNDFDLTRSAVCSFEDCLAKVNEFFPGICHDYVQKLYDTRREQYDAFQMHQQNNESWEPSQHIVDEILRASSYPKEKDKVRDAKRKRRESQDSDLGETKRWESGDHAGKGAAYFDEARKLLQDEFPLVPSSYVRELLNQNQSLYATYAALEATEREFDSLRAKPYARLKKSRRPTSSSDATSPSSQTPVHLGNVELVKELSAARKKSKEHEQDRLRQKEAENDEALNSLLHAEQGLMVECQCCFSDAAINRVLSCNGDELHFFCHDCVKNLVSSEIGMSRAKVTCMDASGCKASFSKGLLRNVLDSKTFEKLEYLEQQAEIVSANLDGLSECPFCAFKAIYPPVEEDREFRCLKPDCEKVSCRLCNEETHIPKSCAEAKKEKGLPARHQIEEAMSEALIRGCPRCKVKIVKLDGCNKMTCTQCGCQMCYVCKKDITGKGPGKGYDHFKAGGCQVHDEGMVGQGLDRHAVEVNNAEKVAIEKARQENPELQEADLKVNKDAKDVPTAQQHVRPGLAGMDIHAAMGDPWNYVPHPPPGFGYIPAVQQPAFEAQELLQLFDIPGVQAPEALLQQNLAMLQQAGVLGQQEQEQARRQAQMAQMRDEAQVLQQRTQQEVQAHLARMQQRTQERAQRTRQDLAQAQHWMQNQLAQTQAQQQMLEQLARQQQEREAVRIQAGTALQQARLRQPQMIQQQQMHANRRGQQNMAPPGQQDLEARLQALRQDPVPRFPSYDPGTYPGFNDNPGFTLLNPVLRTQQQPQPETARDVDRHVVRRKELLERAEKRAHKRHAERRG